MEKDKLIAYRDGVKSDYEFVLATWLRNLRYGNDSYTLIESDTYFKAQHKIIDAILRLPNEKVRVACLADTPDVDTGIQRLQ